MEKPRKVLVYRLSSLGDVAMTVPVVRLLLMQHPGLEITFVSNAFFAPLFKHIEGLRFYPADLKGRHRGLNGLYRLHRELTKSSRFDAVADLHDVLRTKVLRSFFYFSRTPVAVINKGREEKKQLTRKENKILRPLKSTFERYAGVFSSLGLPVRLLTEEGLTPVHPQPSPVIENLERQGKKIVGIAPFAQYREKTYPPEKMKEVIRLLLQHRDVAVLLFGGPAEKEQLQAWETELAGAQSMAGKMDFEKELETISRLHLMVSMDSANMHLASLFGVPVVSVWGATHPYAGFYGWGQQPSNAVQVELYCRPCSVFGNKPGYRGDLLCLTSISPVSVYEKIMHNLS